MEYIREVNISEAIIHILDNNGDEPLLNEYGLELDEDIYMFLLKHVERLLKDEELKYAIFNAERNIVKEVAQEYLNGENNLLEVSKELARQLFIHMKGNVNIPSCDLIILSISTEYGPLLGLLKMDYVKNFTHKVDFIEDKLGIDIIPQMTGLPSSGNKIQKCAFIKPIREGQDFNLMVIDKQNKSKENDEYGSNYFINNFLGCTIIQNERDMTKGFLKAAETWTRKHITEDADRAENIRSRIKQSLKEEIVDVNQLSEELFKEVPEQREHFKTFISAQGLEESIPVDKEWVEKKLKRIRLKIDKDIDLYINEETYNDINRFEIQRNGDGSINMIIKHVINYIEK